MEPDEYERQVARATLPALVLAHQLLTAIQPNPMTETAWLAFLRATFVVVREQAFLAAGIARVFYDAERERQVPGVPRNDVHLPDLTFDRYVRDMEPVRKLASRPDFSVDRVALRVARSVENGARRTIMRAVENPDPDLDPFVDSQEEAEELKRRAERARDAKDSNVVALVKGWARVPTGAETCGFCWMLASRGPVYKTSAGAGARGTQASVIRKTADGSMSSEDMNQWHEGCDCKVVPVFKLDDWAGKDKADAAWKLWESEIKDRYRGKDALNEYRKLVEAGEIQKLMSSRKAA